MRGARSPPEPRPAERVQRPPSSLFALIVDRPVAVLMIFTAVAVFGQVSFLQYPKSFEPVTTDEIENRPELLI